MMAAAKNIFIVFPHHLFEQIELLKAADDVYLTEEALFFNQYKFHKQKLVYHRATMKHYEKLLCDNGISVNYISAKDANSDIAALIKSFSGSTIKTISCYDPCDNWLQRRMSKACKIADINIQQFDSPLYINTANDLELYFKDRQHYFLADFYMQQRKKYRILVDKNGKPEGGKWSFDEDNRLKYPKGMQPPNVDFPAKDEIYGEAVNYVTLNYPDNYGAISGSFIFPYTHEQAKDWLQQFFETRFDEFGAYEDAIVASEHILHHSVLTPMLNIGLLTPKQVINEALRYSRKNNIPLNSLEGFVRQIIGWREFIRGVYIHRGTQQRIKNYWGFTKKIPASFYNGTTGIVPVDKTIQKILITGYCHHIERLMILGNFMLLCEFDPDEVYQWFMEMFIDAYDWVMVPNVYGMSQFADGGLMATKPYISASSYILKMSDYKKGDWCAIWDALFWTFLDRHRDFFSGNPRLSMLLKTYDKMSDEKKDGYKEVKEKWMNDL